ncbi:MAG: hypothetical protein ACLP0L_30865 [Solirubrobacteraceae bacterium]
MPSDPSLSGLELSEVDNPRVRDALARVDAMSDDQLGELVRGEHPDVIEAAEGMIARRRAAERQTS